MNNDLEQFSEERLRGFIDKISVGNMRDTPTLFEMVALARIALAAKQAKPVAWILNNGPSGASHIERDGRIADLFGIFNGNTVQPLYTTPQPAHTEQDGWVSIPKDMLADYRDVKNGEVQDYKASFSSHCDIPGSRWQRDLVDLTEELAEIDKLIAAATKPESE